MGAKRAASAKAASKAKARKVVDPVDTAVDAVCTAVGLYESEQMDKELVLLTAPVSLRLAKEERKTMHTTVLQWVRAALEGRKMAIQAEQASIDKLVAQADTNRAQAAQVTEAAKAVVVSAEAKSSAASSALAEATKIAKEEASKVKPIVKQKAAADADLAKMTKNLEDVHAMNSSVTTAFETYDANAKKAANKIVAFLKADKTADQALAMSASVTLTKAASDRSAFDAVALKHVSDHFLKCATGIENEITEQKAKIDTICASMADNVVAQNNLEHASTAASSASEEFAKAKKDLKEAELAAAKVEKELAAADSNRADLADQLTTHSEAMEEFNKLVARSNVPPPPVEAPPAADATPAAADATTDI